MHFPSVVAWWVLVKLACGQLAASAFSYTNSHRDFPGPLQAHNVVGASDPSSPYFKATAPVNAVVGREDTFLPVHCLR